MTVTFEQIQELSDTIAHTFQPQQIILFGSYAYGKPTPDSDVDLLVVMPFTDHEARQALLIRREISMPFPVDVVVRSPEQLRERLALNINRLRLYALSEYDRRRRWVRIAS